MEETSLSEYELIRLRNIERNLAFLQSIGLGSQSVLRSRNIDDESSSKIPKKPKTKFTKINNEIEESSRRSLRIASLSNIDYADVNDHSDSKADNKDHEKRRKGENGAFIETTNPQQYLLSKFPSSSSSSSSSKLIDPNSTRNIIANYHQFITPLTLGKPHTEFGKAAVVTKSNNGQIPKFSKYSGVLEWNNCIYLWVNLGGNISSLAAETSYDNTFLDEGRSFVWFGGSKMTKG